MSAPLTIERVVENHRDGTSTHGVAFTLTPVEHRQVVGDIARRIYTLSVNGRAAGVRHLILAAGRPQGDLDRQDALTDLMRALGMPAPSWVVDVTNGDAAALYAQLDEAMIEPASCSCGNAVESTDPRVTDCGACADARPLRVGG